MAVVRRKRAPQGLLHTPSKSLEHKHGASRSGRAGPYVRDPPLCLEEHLPSHAPVAPRAASFASPFWATVASAKAV